MGTLNIGRCFPREVTAGPDPESIPGGSGQPAGKPREAGKHCWLWVLSQHDYVYTEESGCNLGNNIIPEGGQLGDAPGLLGPMPTSSAVPGAGVGWRLSAALAK